MSSDSYDSPRFSGKAKFTPEEDAKLKALVEVSGPYHWEAKSVQMPGKSARQCRDRWFNYLEPKLNQEEWTDDEDQKLIDKYLQVGPHWKLIADYLVNRSTNAVRNRLLKLQRKQIVPEIEFTKRMKMAKHAKAKAARQDEVKVAPTPVESKEFDFLEDIEKASSDIFDQIFLSNDTELEAAFQQFWAS